MISKFVFAALGAIGVACSGAGQALADVVYTASIPSQDASLYGPPGLSASLSQFDPTVYGQLTGILITVTTSSIADISVSNFSPSISYSFNNATAITTLAISGPLGYSTNLTTTSTLASGIAAAGSPGVSNFPGIAGGSTSTLAVPAIDYSDYEGTGSYSLTFINYASSASFGGTAIGAPRNTVYFGGGDDLAVNIMVDYQTAPEPASIAIIGAGLIGIAGVRRPRKK